MTRSLGDTAIVGSQYQIKAAREAVKDEHPLHKIAAAAVLLKAGEITEEFFLTVVVDLLRAARAAVAVKVDALVAIMYAVDPVGFTPRDYTDRDMASLATILERGDITANRIQRFAAATLDQAARDFQIEIGKAQGATHWVWRTAYYKGACDDCRAKDGKVFSIDVPMIDHPNCDCYPELIFKEGTHHE